jgi:hypothetical protein
MITVQKIAYGHPALLTGFPVAGVAVDPHHGGGGQAAEKPGGDAGDLDREPGPAGGGAADEDRDDDDGGDDGPQQPHPVDLAGGTKVTGQDGDEDDGVDDHRLGELGVHLGSLVLSALAGPCPADIPNSRADRRPANRSAR